MEKDKLAIQKAIIQMLEDPDESGILIVQKTYDALEKYIQKARVEALGWAYADACIHLDQEKDYRKIKMSEILDRAMKDLA